MRFNKSSLSSTINNVYSCICVGASAGSSSMFRSWMSWLSGDVMSISSSLKLSFVIGRQIWKWVPFPLSLFTVIVPPCNNTKSLVNESPMPVPVVLNLR